MKTARVVGTVVSTIQSPSLGRRKLLCDYIDASGKATGDYVIAVDTVEAGVGDDVLILDEGNGARQILGDSEAPVRAVVVAVVDAVELG